MVAKRGGMKGSWGSTGRTIAELRAFLSSAAATTMVPVVMTKPEAVKLVEFMELNSLDSSEAAMKAALAAMLTDENVNDALASAGRRVIIAEIRQHVALLAEQALGRALLEFREQKVQAAHLTLQQERETYDALKAGTR